MLSEMQRESEAYKIVDCFHDGILALMLVAVGLRHIAGTKWGTRQYLKMDGIEE